jgi:hypothetical protein
MWKKYLFILIIGTHNIYYSQIIHGQKNRKPIINNASIIGTAFKSSLITTNCLGTTNVISSDLNWLPVLTVKSFKPENENNELIEEIKKEKLKNKFTSTKYLKEQASKSITPVVGNNWLGNVNSGTSPLDNNIAIANNGIIVSVANSTIEIDDENGNLLYYNDLVSFFNDGAIQQVCDPTVLYDNIADRFILFFQESSATSDQSKLCVCFSKSNNPSVDGWWKYKFTGNPLNDNSWFDYPKMAISDNELYITGNLFYEGSNTYNQSVLYQFNKLNGYNGGSVNWLYYHNISGNPFTLLPVGNGQGSSFGPGCFLVSTNSSGSSSINLYDLTDDISGNPVLNHYTVSTSSYAPAANASQMGTNCLLDNGDCRALSGFYLNGYIHFVFHSDIGGGWNGINYNRLNLSTLTNQSATFGLEGQFDYSYPSICSYSINSSDKSVLIGFGRSGSSIYPEVRVVNCDDAMNWSSSTLVKSSVSFVSQTSSTEERWGDYTGISRRHNAAVPTAWMNGMFGNSNNKWDSWIAEIGSDGISGINQNEVQNETVKLFPNPVIEMMYVSFTSLKEEEINITIVDLNGRVVTELYSGKAFSGENSFSFNKANLSSGTYFLKINTPTQLIKNEEFVVAN